MAVVLLYRCARPGSNTREKFPEGYEVVGQSIIDDEFADHPEIRDAIWGSMSSKNKAVSYAKTYKKVGPKNFRGILLHRLIWSIKYGEIPNGMKIDHVNHNGLDNRLENIRLATHSQNAQNTRVKLNGLCKYRGVSDYHFRAKGINSYTALISRKRATVYIGCYPKIEEAAFAYDVAAESIYGEFAIRNLDCTDIIEPCRRQEIQDKVARYLVKSGFSLEAI